MKGYNQTNWNIHPARPIKGRRTNWGHRLSKFVSTEKGTPVLVRLLELKASCALDLQRFLTSRGHPQSHKRGGACLTAPIRELVTSTILWSVAGCTWSAPPILVNVRVLLLKFLSVNEAAGAWPRLLVSYWHELYCDQLLAARGQPRPLSHLLDILLADCLRSQNQCGISWMNTSILHRFRNSVSNNLDEKINQSKKKQSCKNRDNPLEDN